ncbi:MAG TPA: hypothetical protein VHE13_01990 [Opitutus sp.]|nr:hypothetical protein [Opitutus sp.]
MNGGEAKAEFERWVARVLRRFCAQNGIAAADDVQWMAARLGEEIGRRGLPPPLATADMGAPGEMTAEEVAPIAGRVLAGVAHVDALATPVRQLVKACWQPEFRKCRDSYREVGADGNCRRQQIGVARGRVSGTHCVDCPYWVELEPMQHEAFLVKQWRAGAADFEANRDIFLPEDFRALRRLVRAMADGVRP